MNPHFPCIGDIHGCSAASARSQAVDLAKTGLHRHPGRDYIGKGRTVGASSRRSSNSRTAAGWYRFLETTIRRCLMFVREVRSGWLLDMGGIATLNSSLAGGTWIWSREALQVSPRRAASNTSRRIPISSFMPTISRIPRWMSNMSGVLLWESVRTMPPGPHDSGKAVDLSSAYLMKSR